MHYKHRVPQLIRIGGQFFFRSLRSRIHYFVPPHYGTRGAAPELGHDSRRASIYTPPTQLNSTAESRRRRRCVLGITVSEIFNVECNAMVDMTLIRPLNKGQDHSPIDFLYATFYRLPIVTFALGRTV